MRTGTKIRSLAVASAAALCALAAPARAAVPRSAHTATLLPNGNVLIAGGVDAGGTILASAELMKGSVDGSLVGAAPMSVARASATATVLANGKVLVAGGITAGGTVLASAEVYDPATNSWSPTANAMTSAHYNHTATRLNNGKVLVCGGQDGSGSVITAVCDLYDPTANSWSAGPSMLYARALHTATLLKDGKVFFAGGWNPNASATNGWLNTTERYDPATNAFNSAHPLTVARGYHSAVMMGDGRVYIAGGFNGKDLSANRGILDTTEIYDPVSNTVVPGPTLDTRRMQTAATLEALGTVTMTNGLGNITTTYLKAPTVTVAASQAVAVGSSTATPGFGNVNTATIQAALSYQLGVKTAGQIENGSLYLSSPTIDFTDGKIYFVPGDINNNASGLRNDLAGVTSDCGTKGCGAISGNFALSNVNQATVVFNPITSISLSGNVTSGQATFTNAGTPANTISSQTVSGDLTPSGTNLQATFSVAMPAELIGAHITSGTVALSGGTVVQASSFTLTITGGVVDIPANTTVVSAGAATAKITFVGTAHDLTGTIDWTAQGDQTFSSVQTFPLPATQDAVTLNGVMTYVADKIDISNDALSVDVATAVIDSMRFSDVETYNPKSNSVALSYNPPPGGLGVVDLARAGPTDTLMPDGDHYLSGGSGCSDSSCSAIVSKNSSGSRVDLTYMTSPDNFAPAPNDLPSPRYFHTSTLLPDGTILVAGGSNGPNILNTGAIYDPATETWSPAANNMRDVRDLHTATLLPDGRVLLAGGFSTRATSTGSIAGCEIYYPDTKLFLPTGSMLSPRSNHTTNLMPDGNPVAVGGYGLNDQITATAEVYYSTAARWQSLASMANARALHATVLLKDGRLLAIGGINSGGVLTSVEAYDPTTNSWSAMASLPHPLYDETATLLFDGRVLVAGGNDGFGEYNASYYYDPIANSWTPTSSVPALLQPRFGHSATLLPNGTVMITGGQTQYGPIPDAIEVFHVNGSSWVSNGYHFSSGARAFHTMTLAANGKLYAIGGTNGAIGGSGTSLLGKVEEGYFTFDPDADTHNAPPSVRQSTISATSAVPQPNTNFTVSGLQFRGGTEASGGGAASGNSSFSFPHLVLQRIDGSNGGGSQSDSGFVVDMTTAIYQNAANVATQDTSLTVLLPPTTAQMPTGWYNARVGANDVYSDGAFIQVGPPKPASAPAGLTGLALGTSSVSWTWSSVTGADGYDVYQATSGVFLGTATAAGFVQDGLTPDTTASILVAGYSISGDGPLAHSTTYYTLPAAPTGVVISSVSFDSLLLQWDTASNNPGTIYEVSESSNDFASSVSTPVPTILGVTTNYALITQLQSNTSYYFRLRAFNTIFVPSDFSATPWVSTVTRASAIGLQGVPKAGTTDTISWSWTNIGAQSYNVYNSSTGALLYSTTTFKFDDTGLATNSLRSVTITAVTGAGEGPLSPAVTTYTNAAAPSPLSPLIINLSSADYIVRWANNGNPNGTVYQLNTYETSGNGVVISTIDTTGFSSDILTGFKSFSGTTHPDTRYDTFIYALNGDGRPSIPLVVGSTYTLAAVPGFAPDLSPAILGTTPVSITLQWNTVANSTYTTYELTYSTDDFVSLISTAIAQAAHFTGSSTTVAGLLTSTTYYFRVRAFNAFGSPTNYTTHASTLTFNGGVASGSLGGILTALGASEVQGNLGDGRFIDLRSPSEAFPSDVAVTVSSYDATGGLCPNGVNVAMRIDLAPALQPGRAVYITFSYAPAELGSIAANRAVLMRYDPAGGPCVPTETTVDTKLLRFTARLNHFSLYQLAQVPLATSPDTARLFPNPYRVAQDGYVTIDQVPPFSRVRIMTLRGETVLDEKANDSGLLTWSATNGSGRPVASGLYFVVVESGGAKKILKLAVIR